MFAGVLLFVFSIDSKNIDNLVWSNGQLISKEYTLQKHGIILFVF